MARAPDDIPEPTLRLLLAKGIGPRTLRLLRGSIGSDERIVAASPRAFRAVPGLRPALAAALPGAIAATDPDGERRLMSRWGARLILRGDPDFPSLLAAIDDPPAALWIRGRLEEADGAALAVVGSRRCTEYGRSQAAGVAGRLAGHGLRIVSGGAIGVDAAAHRGALRVGGRTIAVLGCGLARCYPPEHRRLFERIVESGSSLLSEHPMLAPPLGHHFPRRNRLISGLSLGVLIVEAARRSGALITARLAAEDHGRAVMALPGRADSPAAAGGLRAVRDGWAALVLDDEDVWHQLEGAGHLVRGALELAARTGASSRADDLTDEQSRLLTAVRGCDGGVPADRLAVATARPVGPMLADLTVLEVRGLVVRGADGLVHRADGA